LDAAAARAFSGGPTVSIADPARRYDDAVAIGASDAAADRATVIAYRPATLPPASPMGSTARAAAPSGPIGAGDASSDAFLARARPARALDAASASSVRLGGVHN
jgi:hypothetical protein